MSRKSSTPLPLELVLLPLLAPVILLIKATYCFTESSNVDSFTDPSSEPQSMFVSMAKLEYDEPGGYTHISW